MLERLWQGPQNVAELLTSDRQMADIEQYFAEIGNHLDGEWQFILYALSFIVNQDMGIEIGQDSPPNKLTDAFYKGCCVGVRLITLLENNHLVPPETAVKIKNLQSMGNDRGIGDRLYYTAEDITQTALSGRIIAGERLCNMIDKWAIEAYPDQEDYQSFMGLGFGLIVFAAQRVMTSGEAFEEWVASHAASLNRLPNTLPPEVNE